MPSYARKHLLDKSLLYHVFNRGISRHYLFDDERDKQYFLQLIQKYKREKEFYVYHWVVMSNHYHMVIELEEPERLSSIMSGIARSYTYYYHETHGTSGFLWEGRFKSQAIEKDLYLNMCGRYIERNPVKARMVYRAEEYVYSSAQKYVCAKHDAITDESPTYRELGANETERSIVYQEWLQESDSEADSYFDTMETPVLGKEAFKAALKKINGRFIPRTRGRIID